MPGVLLPDRQPSDYKPAHLKSAPKRGRISKAELNELYDDVFLQAWTRHAHGVEQQYWVVRKNGGLTRPVADRETYALLRSTHQRERDRLETDAQAREHGTRDTGSKTLVALRPWMDRTRWAITYDGVRRDILVDLAEMPYGGADHALGERPSNGASSLPLMRGPFLWHKYFRPRPPPPV